MRHNFILRFGLLLAGSKRPSRKQHTMHSNREIASGAPASGTARNETLPQHAVPEAGAPPVSLVDFVDRVVQNELHVLTEGEPRHGRRSIRRVNQSPQEENASGLTFSNQK
jgi:hypothetical protein